MTTSISVEDFDELFGKESKYPKDVQAELYHGRLSLNNKLFFERLLESIGVNGRQHAFELQVII
jgi:hypothetical protein